MGVDVTTGGGFGSYINKFPEEAGEDVEEYLDTILKGTAYSYLKEGSYYDNEDIEYCVVVKGVTDEIRKQNGFSFLDSVSENLEKFLTEKGFEFSTPNIVWTELWH